MARWQAMVWTVLLLGAGCADAAREVPENTPPRAGRFGSLRDLVLFERAESGSAEALFVDRFEVTRGDWAAFAKTAAGRTVDAGAAPSDGDAALPVGLVSLRQARAFAAWRLLRLPRADELRFVTTGDRSNQFPWGRSHDPMRANTAELGLGHPTPVGTFESGRRAGGDQPYDLIGNVSEWTETVASSWWEERPDLRSLRIGEQPPQSVLDPLGSVRACRRAVLGTPALAAWQGPGGLVPVAWLIAMGGDNVPREVVGSDFQGKMEDEDLARPVPAGDRRARTGIRLCATAGELLQALLREADVPPPPELLQLRRFVQRGRHRAVLEQAWRELAAIDEMQFGNGPLLPVLLQELGLASPPGRRG